VRVGREVDRQIAHMQGAVIPLQPEAHPLLQAMDASGMNHQFVEYTTCALTGAFPHDARIEMFLGDMRHQLLPQKVSRITE
jgi:hypothetical protein